MKYSGLWNPAAQSAKSIFAGFFALSIAVFTASGPAEAKSLLTLEQALKETFSGQRIQEEALFLSDDQVRRIEKTARARQESRVLTRYTAFQEQKIAGYAYIDTHVVRTMPETLLVVLNPDGSIREVLILAFAEPDDYRPRPRWLKTLRGRDLGSDLWPGRGVPKVTGATLTVQAISDAVRRLLALHQVTMEDGS